MKVLSASILRTRNVGDFVCQPSRYFRGMGRLHDMRDQMKGDAIIYGGGALGVRLMQRHHLRHRAAVKIAWGVGTSLPGQKEVPDFSGVQGIQLFGSREYGQPGTVWAPCASCMSPLFDKQYPVKHPVVLYYNNDPTKQRPDIHDLPKAHNELPFEEALAFLGSGQRVVTNSYHGAYWAMLLGREVVIAGAYSSKFHHYHVELPAFTDVSWRRALEASATSFPRALAECREATKAFHGRVLELMS